MKPKNLSQKLSRWANQTRVKVAQKIAPSNQQALPSLDMSLRDWLIYHHQEIVFDKMFWMGVKTQKNPMDMWMYQELLWQLKPDVLVEIGSFQGGSALYFAHLMDVMNHGKVISVDISREHYRVTHPRIETITGDSNAPETVAQVKAAAQGETVLVIHDGDHEREPVLADLRHYADLVTVGSYFIVEDGIVDVLGSDIDWPHPDGPVAAVRTFLMENDKFRIDEACERYILTYNPRGFLKRIA